MRVRTLGLFLYMALILLAPPKIGAHVLEKNNSIGAVLHIDPEDDPVAGQQSGFFFEFKDTQNSFRPEDCICTVSVLADQKEIYSQPLFENEDKPSLTNASFFYTFPEKNIYKIRIVGKPKTQNAFKPFTLSYDVRVARESNSKVESVKTPGTIWSFFSSHIPHTIVGVIVLIALWYVLFKKK